MNMIVQERSAWPSAMSAEARREAGLVESVRRRNRRLTAGLAVALLFICFALFPLLYAYLTFGRGYIVQLLPGVIDHIVMNCIANFVVAIAALFAKGRFDRKLASVLTTVIIVHGALAYLILATRAFYSNEMMLYAAIFSAVAGAISMYLRHEAGLVRVAVLGPVEEDFVLRAGWDHILEPTENLRRYDILLTSGVTDLSAEWTRTLSRAMLAGKQLRHVAEYVEEVEGIVSVDHFDLEHLPPTGLTSYRTRKRLMDIGLVLLALPIALPILAVGALTVRLTMGRPVLFKQSRTGLGGKPFEIYKLRTMAPASEQDSMATTVGDLRITTAGRWLRRYRIDELPQLWNVLKGDMSIIGPRPEWKVLNDRYAQDFPAYEYRNLVRPGITGWAQVRGGYASDLEETRRKVGYDLFYIKNLSFSFDVQILVRTVLTVLTGYGVR